MKKIIYILTCTLLPAIAFSASPEKKCLSQTKKYLEKSLTGVALDINSPTLVEDARKVLQPAFDRAMASVECTDDTVDSALNELETKRITFTAPNNPKLEFDIMMQLRVPESPTKPNTPPPTTTPDETPIAFFVYNNATKKPGDIVQLTDIPKLYWSNECSDHTIAFNLSNKAGVNIAGQRVFSPIFNQDKYEYFLDFQQGNNRRIFPGLVLLETQFTTGIQERLVMTTPDKADEYAKQFANALANTACKNENLVVYTVDLGTTFTPSDTKIDWGLALGGPLLGALVPQKIMHINQITIKSGPYPVKK